MNSGLEVDKACSHITGKRPVSFSRAALHLCDARQRHGRDRLCRGWRTRRGPSEATGAIDNVAHDLLSQGVPAGCCSP